MKSTLHGFTLICFSRLIKTLKPQVLDGHQYYKSHLKNQNQKISFIDPKIGYSDSALPSDSQELSSTVALISTGTTADVLEIGFDNESDPSFTLVNIQGNNRINFLNRITSIFSKFNLEVVDATISTATEERNSDVFKIRRSDGSKLPADNFGVILESFQAACNTTAKSVLPAIYGNVASVIQPGVLFTSAMYSVSEDNATTLEASAFEVAQAAATLATLEREMVQLQTTHKWKEHQKSTAKLVELDTQHTEAAADLERRMAALLGILQARKSLSVPPAEPTSAKGPGAELNQKGGTSTGPAAGSGYEIFLQAFNWESHREKWYNSLREKIPELAEAGFTSLWLPPPSDSVSPQGYLPRDLYSLETHYGNEKELRELIKTIHEMDLMAIADIVINHRCAHYQSKDGKWNSFGGRLAWDATVVCSNNSFFGGTGANKQEDDYPAAPNLDHSQEQLRKEIVQWMKWLKNMVGFDGWRFDFVKGYCGTWTREYIDATVPQVAFGEYWDTMDYNDGVLVYKQDAHRQRTIDWCDRTGGTAAAFDFTTKGILQEAVSRKEYWRLVDPHGRPPGVIGLWPSRAVTFIENHDTGSTLQHWPFPWEHVQEGYAYLLTHPGSPCVFWDHYRYDPSIRKVIVDLIKIRKKYGLHSRSKVRVMAAKSELYAAVVDDRVAVKIGPCNWSPNQTEPDSFQVVSSGHQYAVWVKISCTQ